MPDSSFGDDDARAVRAQWFRYLDTVEPFRGPMHAYCRRLTGNTWDAEDLVQDTLLRGFGMIARGDLHGEDSPVRNAKAYLFRAATNLWLDVRRKRRREAPEIRDERAVEPSDPTAVNEAMVRVVALGSPQEIAALLLKDVFGFTVEEVADFVGTTPATITTALSRVRRKVRDEPAPRAIDPVTKSLAKAFAEAINVQDLDRVMALMSESIHIVVCNVGGGRGRGGVWTSRSLTDVEARYAEHDGEPVIVLKGRDGVAFDVVRVEGVSGAVTKIIDYCYAPETLEAVAEALQIPIRPTAYHQPAESIRGMIETTALPWRTE